MLLVVFSLLAVASIRAKNIGTLRELPDITSASLPRNQWHAQDGQGQWPTLRQDSYALGLRHHNVVSCLAGLCLHNLIKFTVEH